MTNYEGSGRAHVIADVDLFGPGKNQNLHMPSSSRIGFHEEKYQTRKHTCAEHCACGEILHVSVGEFSHRIPGSLSSVAADLPDSNSAHDSFSFLSRLKIRWSHTAL